MDVFLNGRFVPESQAVVSVSDRGFLYGDSLFETLRVCGGRPFRWSQHLERLEAGAEFLKIGVPWTARELFKFACSLAERNAMKEAALRITLSRGSGTRGYSPRGAANPTLSMTLHPLPIPCAALRLKISSFRLNEADPLGQFKTGNKLLNVLARAEAEEADADDGLLLNRAGHVAEASGSNVFCIGEGTVFTPPTSEGALPGITRSGVVEICLQLGVRVEERPLKPEELQRANGVFLTNSIAGIVSAASLDGHPLNVSPFVEDIQRGHQARMLRECCETK